MAKSFYIGTIAYLTIVLMAELLGGTSVTDGAHELSFSIFMGIRGLSLYSLHTTVPGEDAEK